MLPDQIEKIRRFNRLVTQRVGALQDSYLSQGRPLGEARLVYEIGPQGADLRALRSRLSLDSGYLSRLLRSLEGQGIVAVEKDASDSRVRRAILTETGRREYEAYDRLSDDFAESMLGSLDRNERERLVAAMDEVRNLLGASAIDMAVEAPDTEDARWCLGQYYAELASRFEQGFEPANGNWVSDQEMLPPAGYLLLARIDGKPVGCAALLKRSGETAEIKRMWTVSSARGQGVARRMLRKLECIARDAGFGTLCLDTNRTLTEAHALYRAEGFHEIARYNDNPYADHWFEKRIEV